jgi:hypothetical protein
LAVPTASQAGAAQETPDRPPALAGAGWLTQLVPFHSLMSAPLLALVPTAVHVVAVQDTP